MLDPWSYPEGQETEWWHPSHHWSSMHHGQGTRGQVEMVWAYTTERRRWLRQTNPRGRRPWTTKSRKTEKEMARRRQVQHGGLVAHGGGHMELCQMEKENPCGWPLIRGIHSLKEREIHVHTWHTSVVNVLHLYNPNFYQYHAVSSK